MDLSHSHMFKESYIMDFFIECIPTQKYKSWIERGNPTTVQAKDVTGMGSCILRYKKISNNLPLF